MVSDKYMGIDLGCQQPRYAYYFPGEKNEIEVEIETLLVQGVHKYWEECTILLP